MSVPFCRLLGLAGLDPILIGRWRNADQVISDYYRGLIFLLFPLHALPQKCLGVRLRPVLTARRFTGRIQVNGIVRDCIVLIHTNFFNDLPALTLHRISIFFH